MVMDPLVHTTHTQTVTALIVRTALNATKGFPVVVDWNMSAL